MFISLRELEIQKLEFQQEFRPGAIDLGAEVTQQTPLQASGSVDLIKEAMG